MNETQKRVLKGIPILQECFLDAIPSVEDLVLSLLHLRLGHQLYQESNRCHFYCVRNSMFDWIPFVYQSDPLVSFNDLGIYQVLFCPENEFKCSN